MKMKGQLNVNTPAEYIAAVDDERRSDIAALDALIRKHAPKLEPVIMDGMLGYGPFHYRYASAATATPASSRPSATPRTSRCAASPPTPRVTSPSGTSSRSPRPASARPACGSRSSPISTRRRSWRSSRRPRRWASSPEPARRRGGGRPRAGGRIASTGVRAQIGRDQRFATRRHRRSRRDTPARVTPPSTTVHAAHFGPSRRCRSPRHFDSDVARSVLDGDAGWRGHVRARAVRRARRAERAVDAEAPYRASRCSCHVAGVQWDRDDRPASIRAGSFSW